jgi:hypothetical protein
MPLLADPPTATAILNKFGFTAVRKRRRPPVNKFVDLWIYRHLPQTHAKPANFAPAAEVPFALQRWTHGRRLRASYSDPY